MALCKCGPKFLWDGGHLLIPKREAEQDPSPPVKGAFVQRRRLPESE